MNILHIGGHHGQELREYFNKGAKQVIFIEAIPSVYEILKNNIEQFNKQNNTNYKAYNYLVTNKDNETIDFHLINTNYCSSSIYKPNDSVWQWKNVKHTSTIQLPTKRMTTILVENSININDFQHLVVDVQGAELEVLKSFDDLVKNFTTITVEISRKPFYQGGVLFKDLNMFLIDNGYKLIKDIQENHGNVVYQKCS